MPLLHGHYVGPDTPMPSALSQKHWEPAVGDRVTAWIHCPEGGAFDGNATPACGYIWFLHWGKAGLDGYHYLEDENGHMVVGGVRVRPMNRAELRRPASKWGHHDQIKRWTDKHGQHPMTVQEGLAWCVRNNRTCAIEPKGPAWAKNKVWFRILAKACDDAGHPRWCKRIATLRFPKGTVANAHAARMKIAAIYGHGVRGRIRRRAHTARLQRGWGGLRFDATW